MTQANNGIFDESQRWRAFAVLSIAVFISILDLFIVNIAFVDIEREWPDAGRSQLSWILSAYAIVLAALLVPLGRIGDMAGRKLVFQAGLVTFIIASAACAFATTPEMLIAARVVQGIGAAALTPTSLSLLLPLFPAKERAAVIGAWAALGGVGAAMGPPLGGLLVEASWRWIFIVNVPLGLFTVFAVRKRFAEIRDERATSPDVLGSVLLIVAVASLTLGLVQGPDWDWDGRVLGSFAVAVVATAWFIARSRRHSSPALDLELFRNPSFSLAVASTLLFFAGFAALLLGGVLFLSQIWGYSVLEAGLGFAPGPAMAAICAAIGGRLTGRIGPGPVGAAGGTLFAIGTAWMIALPATPDYVASYLPTMIVGGAGVGLILPSFTTAAVSAVRPERLSTGIGAETTFRQIGAALGVAAWVAIVGEPGRDEVLEAFDRGFAYMAICSFAAGLTLAALWALSRKRPGGVAGPAPASEPAR